LDQWGYDALVIPHGTAWGLSNPPTADWAHELTPGIANDKRQSLVEVYSGHGNSEEYRSWREFTLGPDGRKHCPEPTRNYLPMCWQAGHLIRVRCEQAHLPKEECDRREVEARQRELDAVAVARQRMAVELDRVRHDVLRFGSVTVHECRPAENPRAHQDTVSGSETVAPNSASTRALAGDKREE